MYLKIIIKKLENIPPVHTIESLQMKNLKKNIDYAILLSWNYKKFFIKNSLFSKTGKGFIIPFPKPIIFPLNE